MTMVVFLSLLNNSFAVSRRVRLPDGQGGWTITWSPLTTLQGRIRPASSSEQEVAAKEMRQISHVLYVVAGSDIARGDLVECGDLAVDVLGVREPSLANEHWEIDCLERQYEANTELGS